MSVSTAATKTGGKITESRLSVRHVDDRPRARDLQKVVRESITHASNLSETYLGLKGVDRLCKARV